MNYKQGGLYENIELFGLDTYLPQTKMAISSVVDGTATITATHADTGMSASVNVNVSTLRNEFFLFQLTPAARTSLVYTDGAGAQKTVLTNSEGVLALYEPAGIASDISLRADIGGSVYLGTIYKANLLSGERDATQLQFYPLSTFKLREAARVDLAINTPDGSPFSGQLVLRGGVYKNGAYCQDALMSATDTYSLADGKAAQTATVTNGKLSVFLDSTEFWSSELGETSADAVNLSSRDNIQYIFELSEIDSVGISLNVYRPMFVYVDGNLTVNDVMRSGESVLALESAPNGGAPEPFVSNQFMDYGLSGGKLIDVKNSTGRVGPSSTYPRSVLKTVCLLWGESDANGYTVTISDDYHYTPPAQTSRALSYPFSSIPAIENDLTLTALTMTASCWVLDGDETALRRIISKAGTVVSDLALPFRAIDMTRVPGVEWSDDVADSLSAPDVDMSGSGAGGAILEFIIKTVDGGSGPVDIPFVKMLISPGADNSVFNAFVWAGYDGTYLGNAEYSSDGIAIDAATLEPTLGHTIEMATIKQMAAGEYFTMDNYRYTSYADHFAPGRHRVDPTFNVEGYYEFELRYDPDTQEWTAQTLGGGFKAGIGIWVNYVLNGWLGPAPVTAEFNFRGGVQLDFKAATRYAQIGDNAWSDPEAGSVTDFLTTLRLSAYFDAFGGFGFDYTLIALKVGLFGRITIDNKNSFLSRTYLADAAKRQLNGQQLHLEGEAGVRFAAKILFITYTVTLGSGSIEGTYNFNNWDEINNYWSSNSRLRSLMSAYAAGSGLTVTQASTGLSSRDYLLDGGARAWYPADAPSLMSLDPSNGVTALQTNANPRLRPPAFGRRRAAALH